MPEMPPGQAPQLQGVYGQSGFGADDQAAVAAMSDQAKQVAATRPAAMDANTQQNLKAALDEKHAGTIKSLKEQAADQVMDHLKPDPKKNPQEYMDALSDRIAEIQKQIKLTKTSGNMVAYNTYMQVNDLLKQRLANMQGQLLMGGPLDEQKYAAGGQK